MKKNLTSFRRPFASLAGNLQNRSLIALRASFALIAGMLPAQSEVPGPNLIQTVLVGDAGHPGRLGTENGVVNYEYYIVTFEVTNHQYVAFSNAVAATDPHGLYHEEMGTNVVGNIFRSGSSGSYRYTTTRPLVPVSYVSFWDTLRFANWLSNGQPVGSQSDGTTETGVYLLTPESIENYTVTRDAAAFAANGAVALANDDEWL